MKLSNETVSLLKNYATINQSLLIRQGKTQRTISRAKNIFARADFPEEFPQEVALFDLNEFISVLSLFDNPDVEFKDKMVVISEGNNSVRYAYTDPQLITSAPDKDPKWSGSSFVFTLPQQTLEKVLSAAGVMKLPHVSIAVASGSVTLRAHDKGNEYANNYDAQVATIDDEDLTANIDFKTELFKFVGDDYKVQVGGAKIVLFEGTKVSYYLAPDDTSEITEK